MDVTSLLPDLNAVNEQFQKVKGITSLAELRDKMSKLEIDVALEENWSDPNILKSLSQQLSLLKKEYQEWVELEKEVISHNEMYELLKLDPDEELIGILKQSLVKTIQIIEEKELKYLLSDRFDKGFCYLSINSGAGGTESNDWVAMLSRMYMRWCDQHEFRVTLIDELAGEDTGIKNITLFIEGNYVYGYLKAEQGVHRLVRISPFDANKKRHTSFASVAVFPDIKDDLDIEVNPSDLRIDTYRASGAGGQHINKTESAVRIVHKPTGIIVACQEDRSQHKNKDKAMKMLKARLYQLYQEQKQEEIKQLEGSKKDIAWGSQIRSYVFQPYKLVKDNRTNFEVGNIDKVMDGDLDPFIFHYLKWALQNKS